MRIAQAVRTLCLAPVLAAVACTNNGSTSDAGNTSLCAAACATGLSCTQNADFPGAACTAPCNVDAGTGCPTGMVCAPQSTGAFCVHTCTTGPTAPACPDGLTCSTTGIGSVCVSPRESISSGINCAPPTLFVGPPAGPASDPGVCVNPRVTSALPAGDVQSLGVHQTGTPLLFTVPQGAIGFSIVSQAVDAGAFIVYQGFTLPNLPIPTPLLTPQGATFFDDISPPVDQTTANLTNASPNAYVGVLTFPNTTPALAIAEDGGLPGGSWTLVVSDYAHECLTIGCTDGGSASNTYDVSVLVRPGPFPATGHLAADIYIVSDTLDAGAALGTAQVQQFAARYAEFYAQAGVCISSVTLHDIPAWARAKYASLAVDDAELPCSDFRQMMTLAEPGTTMALFLVDELTATISPDAGTIVGLDGAIPGPATFNGTIAGGAVASLADLLSDTGCGVSFNPSCGPDVVAYVAAHETGHYLGLYHPTELTGDFFDPLVDTPACVCALCELNSTARAACSGANGAAPTLVLPAQCGQQTQECGGSDLLMFWILDNGSVGRFSPEQAAMVRANPLVTQP